MKVGSIFARNTSISSMRSPLSMRTLSCLRRPSSSSRTCASRRSKTALNNSFLLPQYWESSPRLTFASLAMARILVPSYPYSQNSCSAASRKRVRASSVALTGRTIIMVM